MTARSYWLEMESNDSEREGKLPRWARERIAHLRRQCERLLAGVIERRELTADERVTLSLGSNGYGDTLVRVLPNTAHVSFRATGGELTVELIERSGRYFLRIVGFGTFDSLRGDRHEIAMQPAMGNVVEVGFVMPATETYSEQLSLDSLRPEIEASRDPEA